MFKSMKALTVTLTALGCVFWLGYALLAAVAADIEGGDGNDQLVIAVTGVAALGVAAWLAARERRAAATLVMLLSAATLVSWLALLS